MHATCTYHIEVRGQLAESELNAKSPWLVTLARADPNATEFTVCADQSGVIGLLRHLHGRGFVILSMSREG